MRVCYKWLGRRKFRKGVQLFLQKFQFKAFEANDFWKILEDVSQEPVCEVMSALSKSRGFAVLKINLIYWENTAIVFEIVKVSDLSSFYEQIMIYKKKFIKFQQSIAGSPYDLKIPLFVKTSGGCGLVFEKKN